MVKCCCKCKKEYHNKEYIYCPICSAKLKEIDKDYLTIKKLININKIDCDEDIFEIDKKNKILRVKWNDETLSFPFRDIIDSLTIKTDPPTPSLFEIVCVHKKRWDQKLKNDLPDFEKKLTFNQVCYCTGIMNLMRYKGDLKFISQIKIDDFSTEDILNALKTYGLICHFEEIKNKELYLIITESKEEY